MRRFQWCSNAFACWEISNTASKTCRKRPFAKRPKTKTNYRLMQVECIAECFKRSILQYFLPLNAGQKYCRMLQGEHFAILSTFIKLPFVIKIFVLSIFEWLLKRGFTVLFFCHLLIFMTQNRGVPAYTQSTQLRTLIFECPKIKSLKSRKMQ